MRALTLRIPLPVALPLLISVLMLCSVSAQLVLFYVHACRAVRNLAEQTFRDGAPQSDDISFVIIKVTGAGNS